MTIKTECVIAHLKHDWTEIAKITSCAVVAALVAAGIVIGISSGVVTGYVALNAITGSIVILATVGIAAFWDKESFAVVSDGAKSYTDVGLPITIAFFTAAVPYGIYIIIRMAYPLWESPFVSMIVFTILILLGTPIGAAIARCKE